MKLYHNENLVPLEIWHGLTTWGPLYQVPMQNFEEALREFLVKLHAGKASTLYASDNENLFQVLGFRKLYLTGGAAVPVFRSFAQQSFPFLIELLDKQRPKDFPGLIIDWGQTTIKAISSRRTKIYPRDFHEFPLRQDNAISTEGQKNRIRCKLLSIVEDFEKPELLYLALPLKIDSKLFAEPSTYEGLDGSLKELFANLDLPPVVIMNDAVLAALRVPPSQEKSLVLTLGFGVGGALWKG